MSIKIKNITKSKKFVIWFGDWQNRPKSATGNVELLTAIIST